MIEKIICPNLNLLEANQVFVKFNNTENPIEIMCPNYQDGKCTGTEDDTDKKCIYSSWKSLKK